MVYTLVPAYGRDYKSKAALLADWEDGKDFRIVQTGQYTSIRDDHAEVMFRYAKLTKALPWKAKV